MDIGTELKNSIVLEFLKTHQIKTRYITVINPQSHGVVENLQLIMAKNNGKINILNQTILFILLLNKNQLM